MGGASNAERAPRARLGTAWAARSDEADESGPSPAWADVRPIRIASR